MKPSLIYSAFIMLLLSACSSEDPMPLSYVEGEFSDNSVELTYNGNVIDEAAVIIKLESDDNTAGVEGMTSRAQVVFGPIYCVLTEDSPDYQDNWKQISDYYNVLLVIDSEVVSYSDRIALKGERTLYDNNGDLVRFTLEGTYSHAPAKSPLHLNVRREVISEELSGKTFEMTFDENLMKKSVSVYDGTPLPATGLAPAEALDKFCRSLVDNYVARSGYDALRFTFNGDGTITVLAREKDSGNYVAQQTSSSYQISYGGRIFIHQSQEWTQNLLKDFSPFSYETWGHLPGGVFEFTMHTGIENFTCLSASFYLENGNLVITPRAGLKYIDWSAGTSFIRNWTKVEGKDDYGADLYTDLSGRLYYGDMDFTIGFVARPVE